MDIYRGINVIVSYSVIVPILYLLFNLELLRELKSVFFILTISLLAELTSIISKNIFHNQIINVSYIYSIFEIGFLVYFYLMNSDRKYKNFILSISVLLSLYLIANFFFDINNISIVYAIVSLFELIIVSIYMLKNTNNILRNWKFTIFFAFFQYNVLAIGVFSIVDFIAAHPQFAYYYFILHSTANLLLYTFITIAILQCKKQFYRA